MRVNHQQSSNIIQDYINFHKNIYQSKSTFFLNLSALQCPAVYFTVLFLSVTFSAAQAIKQFYKYFFAYQGHLLYDIWIVFLREADINGTQCLRQN